MSTRDINADIPAGPSVKVGICLDFPIEDVKQTFLDAVRLAAARRQAAGRSPGGQS